MTNYNELHALDEALDCLNGTNYCDNIFNINEVYECINEISISDTIKNIYEGIKAAINKLINGIKKLLGKITNKNKDAKSKLEKLKSETDKCKEDAKEAYDNEDKNSLHKISKTLDNLAKSLEDIIKDNFGPKLVFKKTIDELYYDYIDIMVHNICEKLGYNDHKDYKDMSRLHALCIVTELCDKEKFTDYAKSNNLLSIIPYIGEKYIIVILRDKNTREYYGYGVSKYNSIPDDEKANFEKYDGWITFNDIEWMYKNARKLLDD